LNYEYKKRLNNILEKLRGQGNRLTPQRIAIINAIVEDDSHPSVELIYEKLNVTSQQPVSQQCIKQYAFLKILMKYLNLNSVTKAAVLMAVYRMLILI